MSIMNDETIKAFIGGMIIGGMIAVIIGLIIWGLFILGAWIIEVVKTGWNSEEEELDNDVSYQYQKNLANVGITNAISVLDRLHFFLI